MRRRTVRRGDRAPDTLALTVILHHGDPLGAVGRLPRIIRAVHRIAGLRVRGGEPELVLRGILQFLARRVDDVLIDLRGGRGDERRR